ncbi:gamma-parvin isoform X4 [Erinaceus europaeus]|uniref:Gamma-parvin isoform X4 n=1 Tax=Erinaceus europaeus TaxID=9365 RepID=A0ABM3X8H9_ERIEU|nr:gamma-parvin isoform X4 [Erinaceus europaeus]
METESLYNLLQLPKEVSPPVEELPQGEKKKFLPPTSRKEPKFEELQKVLMEWINTQLLPEHIVVRSLEEDIFDGLILHHLFPIFNKDLLATLHLLVALATRFQPDLPLPPNVQVEVIFMESTKSGLKSEKLVEQLTECSTEKDQSSQDAFDELFKVAPEKVGAVKEGPWPPAWRPPTRARAWGFVFSGQAIVQFVNQKIDRLGLSVQNLDTQFADGVILLLLIGQLEGFFLHLKEFYLTPSSPAEMLHNVTLALELLKDQGLLSHPVSPEDIVNKDTKSTLRVLYSLFHKHKLKGTMDGMPRGSPN